MVDYGYSGAPSVRTQPSMSYDLTPTAVSYAGRIKSIHSTLSWTITHYRNKGKDHIGKGFLYQTDYLPEEHGCWVIAT